MPRAADLVLRSLRGGVSTPTLFFNPFIQLSHVAGFLCSPKFKINFCLDVGDINPRSEEATSVAVRSPQQRNIYNESMQRIGSGSGSWPKWQTFKILLCSC